MRSSLLAAAIAASFTTSAAHAFWNDRIEVFADQTFTHDSNVFRLSSAADAQSALGTGSRGDWFSVTSLGATLDVPYSLQRFQAGYTWFATRYDRFDQLDFNGHNARANWLWAVTPHVTGEVGAGDSKTLASFAVFRTTARDLVTSRSFFANGTWAITPSYQLYAGVTRDEREHDDATRRINDLEVNAVEGRFSYVTAAENRFGISVRREEGEAPETQQLLGVAFNNKYRQDSVGAVVRWQVTGPSRLEGRLDYVRRRYDQFTDRDYSGPSFRLTHTWVPTGKLTFTSAVYREIAPIDEVQTSFVLATGVSVRPRWDLTSKIAILGNLEYARWDYHNVLPFIPGSTIPTVVPPEYRHNNRTFGVSAVWRPFRRVMFQAGVLREKRSSTFAFADYEVTVASIEGRIGF